MSTMGFVKGMIAGAAVGGAAMLMFDPITPRQRKRVKRQAVAAWRNIEHVADEFMRMKR